MAGILLEGKDVTDEQRAAHARALSAEKRAVALRRATETKSRVGDRKLTEALAIDGKVIADQIVDAGAHWSSRLPIGRHLRIIDLEGQQAVDFLCYKPALIVEVDRPTHDDEEQKIFDVNRTRVLEAEGFLVVRVGERVVRDGIDHAVDWIARVGEMVLAKQIVSVELRRLDTVPLP